MEIKFEKIQKVKLPFDMRSPEPNKNYGISGMRVWFILKGPKGATQFMFGVGVYLPHVESEYKANGTDLNSFHDIGVFSGWDVGYHALEPQYDGHAANDDCDILGCKCYYDGSSLRASDKVKEFFSIRGEPIEPHIWKFLEDEYYARFGNEN